MGGLFCCYFTCFWLGVCPLYPFAPARKKKGPFCVNVNEIGLFNGDGLPLRGSVPRRLIECVKERWDPLYSPEKSMMYPPNQHNWNFLPLVWWFVTLWIFEYDMNSSEPVLKPREYSTWWHSGGVCTAESRPGGTMNDAKCKRGLRVPSASITLVTASVFSTKRGQLRASHCYHISSFMWPFSRYRYRRYGERSDGNQPSVPAE